MLRRLLPFTFLFAAAIGFSQEAKQPEPVPEGRDVYLPVRQEQDLPRHHAELTVYVPKQYDGQTPACVYVNQDGFRDTPRPSSTS